MFHRHKLDLKWDISTCMSMLLLNMVANRHTVQQVESNLRRWLQCLVYMLNLKLRLRLAAHPVQLRCWAWQMHLVVQPVPRRRWAFLTKTHRFQPHPRWTVRLRCLGDHLPVLRKLLKSTRKRPWWRLWWLLWAEIANYSLVGMEAWKHCVVGCVSSPCGSWTTTCRRIGGAWSFSSRFQKVLHLGRLLRRSRFRLWLQMLATVRSFQQFWPSMRLSWKRLVLHPSKAFSTDVKDPSMSRFQHTLQPRR